MWVRAENSFPDGAANVVFKKTQETPKYPSKQCNKCRAFCILVIYSISMATALQHKY